MEHKGFAKSVVVVLLLGGLVLLGASRAYAPPIGAYVQYGLAYVDADTPSGVPLDRSDTEYTITATVAGWDTVSTYTMGDKESDYYLVNVTLYSSAPEGPVVGDTAYVYINGHPINENPVILEGVDFFRQDISVQIPPGTVEDLVATQGSGDAEVDLTWTAPRDDGDIGTATRYDVRYSTSSIDESNFEDADGATGEPTPGPPGTVENMTIGGLIPGTMYYFALKTLDDVSNASSISNVDTAIAEGETVSPTAPTGLVATAYPDSVVLSWNANTEPNLHAYYIYRDTSSPASTLLDSVTAQSPPDTFHTDTAVVSGTTYYYRITAVDSAGNESGYSHEVTATPPRHFIPVSLPDTSLAAGDTLSVPIVIGDVTTGLGVISADISISYNSDVVTAVKASTEGTLAEGLANLEFHVLAGEGTLIDTVKISMATREDTLSGSGNLVRIKFAASESAVPGDASILSFEQFFFNEGNPTAVTQDGSVTIRAKFGDVSGNGRVMAFDAALILRERVGLITLPDPHWPGFTVEVADVSGNGEISAYDASLVLQYVVGKIERFPVEEEGLPKLVSGSRRVHLGSAEALSDGSFVLPVIIDEMEDVVSGQIELSFDRTWFRGIQAAKSDLTEGYLFASKVFDDKVKLSFAGAESKSGSGRIATVRFERIGGGSDGIEGITLQRVQLNEGRIAILLPSAQIASGVAMTYRLAQNFPNPFNPLTTIAYDLPKATDVTFSIYTITGQRVATLVSGRQEAGDYQVTWDGSGFATGIYLYRLEAESFTETRKALLLR